MLHYYILRITARLIGKNVRRQKLTISAILHRKPVLTEGRRLSLSVFPLKRAPHAEWNNEIEKTAVFLLHSHLGFK